MKKIILIIMCITVTLSVGNVAKCSDKNIKEKSYNEETFISVDDFQFDEPQRILRESGNRDISVKEIINNIIKGKVITILGEIVKSIYYKTFGNNSYLFNIIWQLFLTIIISCFFTNFTKVFSKDDVSETGFFICYLVSVTFMFGLFSELCNIAVDFVEMLLTFMYGIVPTYFLSVAITGQVSASGFYQLCLVIISVAQFVFLHMIIPLIKIYVAVSIVNNISKEDFLSRTAVVVGNIVNFLMKTFVGIVTGLNIIQALILPSIDSTKNQTIRKVIGSVPVVGNSTDAITGIFLGSANLIKNAIGTTAIIVIVVLCAVPFLKIQLYSFLMQIVAALVQPIADCRIVASFNSMSIGMRMLAKVITGCSLLFIISIAIICMCTGKG
ncbi:MAG: stage III sporulation protein AE [Eubacterium sp.]